MQLPGREISIETARHIAGTGAVIHQGDAVLIISREGAVAISLSNPGNLITAYPSSAFNELSWALIFELGLI